MTEYSREDGFPMLLNALGLFGVAAEVGVRHGDFSRVMLEKWRGSR
jgi:hypothetical protein